MSITPEIGEGAGQQYDVASAIRSFLHQMAEGGTRVAPALIKELIQNADDAGADTMSVVLDERKPPAGTVGAYSALCVPALLVRNNAPFRTANNENLIDDFSAIREVASEHKRAQVTAAGRFGIGFNSVYFLTDVPVIFSRREVHVFDLLHVMFADNGWRFPLDKFPASTTSAGPIKTVLEWILPKLVLSSPQSFGELANDRHSDYRQAVFRLPLRQSAEGSKALYEDRFPTERLRLQALSEMISQAARALLFLKHLRTISFGLLRDKQDNQIEELARIEVSAEPPSYQQFLNEAERLGQSLDSGERIDCSFRRDVKWWSHVVNDEIHKEKKSLSWSFEIKHVARFDDPELLRLRKRLHQNREKAIPWASLAIPLDSGSIRFDSTEPPAWRSFLPLNEAGPCGCVLSGAFFVGPSRRHNEFRLDGSDEAKRKTEWNKALVDRVLLPLFRDVSADMPELLGDLVTKAPKDYLSLFPVNILQDLVPTSLSEHVQKSFSAEPWILRIEDIWGERIDLTVDNDAEGAMVLDMVPAWLMKYRDNFSELSSDERGFIPFAVGESIRQRIGDTTSINIGRNLEADVYRSILSADRPPDASDIAKLLSGLSDSGPLKSDDLSGLWAFVRLSDGMILPYQANSLYVSGESGRLPRIHEDLLQLELVFRDVERVSSKTGLPLLSPESRREIDNIVPADEKAALELLRRVEGEQLHDMVLHASQISRLIDFLISIGPTRIPSDLRLGFLIRTAHNKQPRRSLGTILLPQENPSSDDAALWEAVFHRTFAEVDHEFVPELRRLLRSLPNVIETLHEPGCRLVLAEAKIALDILHVARLNNSSFFDRLKNDFEKYLKRGGQQAAAVQRTTTVLISDASDRWNKLSTPERITVLALPIHRKTDGSLTGLVNADVTEIPELTTFRLQSEDDLRDAPIFMQDYTLLQTTDRAATRFYRQSLGLEVHGRTAVLKDILRQIGSDGENDTILLEYLAKYYPDTVEWLRRSAEDLDKDDAEELEGLKGRARTIPCIDGKWRVEASDASVVLSTLKKQGWEGKALTSLIDAIFWDQPVVTLENKLQAFVLKLHDLPSLPVDSLYGLALTSESSRLTFRMRCKLLVDNWRPPSPLTVRASALDAEMIPTYGGELELQNVVLVEEDLLSRGSLRYFCPEGIDGTRLAELFGVDSDDLPKLSKSLHITLYKKKELADRIVQTFAETWAQLNDKERIEILNYIGVRVLTELLFETASGMGSVRVLGKKVQWKPPSNVLSPNWIESQPPVLSQDFFPATDGLSLAALDVWSQWCGLNSLQPILEAIVSQAETLSGNTLRKAAPQISVWLETLNSNAKIKPNDLKKTLKETRWVLAQRQSELRFLNTSEVLVHDGATILSQGFWVPAVTLPNFVSDEPLSYGFKSKPPTTVDSLEQIASGLEKSVAVPVSESISIYRLIRDLLEEEESLAQPWLETATQKAVFRLFRKPDQLVRRMQTFIGTADDPTDVGNVLFNLHATETLPRAAIPLYRRLGIVDEPMALHGVLALASLRGRADTQLRTFGELVRIFVDDDELVASDKVEEIRIPSCAGTLEPIRECYWDEEWGVSSHTAGKERRRLIDTSNKYSVRLVSFLNEGYAGVVQHLASVAKRELFESPRPVPDGSSAGLVLGAWRDWFEELGRADSMLRADLESFDPRVPSVLLNIVAADNMKVRYVFPDGGMIEPASAWEGPNVTHDVQGTVYVNRRAIERDYLRNPKALEQLDKVIARNIAEILLPDATFDTLEHIADILQKHLERPGAELERIQKSNKEHFFHQYHDQVADPSFATSFEEYRKTKRGTERYQQLENELWEILSTRFVEARREQIRGHGYDDVSVFAEIVQNSEDAYLQRDMLDMDAVDLPFVTFSYVSAQGPTLTIEHKGRPFNYWRHGSRKDNNYSRDVDGVLRSAGSYKPLSQPRQATERTLGRFGLGFKSVYFLTNNPVIHSGQWHFQIEAGCLPKQVLPPEDLSFDTTRIVLPLLPDISEFFDPEGKQLANLLPFLRRVERIMLISSDAGPNADANSVKDLRVKLHQKMALNSDGSIVEDVSILGTSHVPQGLVRFVRLKHRDHSAQLGILLSEDGLPAPWSDAFGSDIYAVLPLRSRLGCGVAVSHLFEVQSGRTHFVDPKTNRDHFENVASLLSAIPQAIVHLQLEKIKNE